MNRAGASRIERIALVAAVGAALGLALVNWRLKDWYPDISAAVAEAARPAAPVASKLEAPAAPKPVVDYRNVLARPLFDASRRPPPAAPVKQAAPTAPPPTAAFPTDKFKLVGVLSTGNQPSRALVRINPTDPGVWVAEGGSVEGWRLDRVAGDRAEFSADGAKGVLKLSIPAGVPSVTKTAAAAPAARSPGSGGPAPLPPPLLAPLPALGQAPAQK